LFLDNNYDIIFAIEFIKFTCLEYEFKCETGIMMQNMTIYEIAKIAGVSASTVSRVLNNSPNVKEATRKLVLECIDKYHYSPSETARGLIKQSSKMVGILLPDARIMHHAESITFIQRELSAMGYCCLVMTTGRDEQERLRCLEILNQRRVDAAVLMGSSFQLDSIKNAIEKYLSQIPIIIANGYLELPNVYGIISDEYNGVLECVRLLFEKGRKKLAFIADYDTPSNQRKIAGFSAGMEKYYREHTPLIIWANGEFHEACRKVSEFMQKSPNIDGLIFAEDQLAAAGLRALRDMQISVPDQVSVIGINNSIITQICNPSLTALDNMSMDMSAAVVNNLIAVLQGRCVVKKMSLYSRIVERETT